MLDEDYVRTARSKRLPARLVYLRHALPNALTASLTIGGLFLAGLVAGTVLVENVFAWPGLGSTIVQSMIDKDYPVAQAIVPVARRDVLLVIHLVVDILLAIARPALDHPRELRWGSLRADPPARSVRSDAAAPSGRARRARLLRHLRPRDLGRRRHAIDTAAMLEGPSREHRAGTDALGRDILARVLVATRSSVWYAVLVTAVASTRWASRSACCRRSLGRRAARHSPV